MCYLLQANFNGRFVANPFAHDEPSPPPTATDTTRDTAQEEAKCRHRGGGAWAERERERARGGVGGSQLFSLQGKNELHISATLITYLVTAPAP